jgi:hypothetical protein
MIWGGLSLQYQELLSIGTNIKLKIIFLSKFILFQWF